MNSKLIKRVGSICLLFSFSLFVGAQKIKPNIILIVADDLGYGDLGCYGSLEVNTPNIDCLAEEGVRFTQFYSNGPECSPTRAALLSGMYQQRIGGLECAIGLGNIGRYPEAKMLSDAGKIGLPISYSVLPSALKTKGYNAAMIGKWHLGETAEFHPNVHGFDLFIGLLGGGVDYFHHTEPKGEFLGTIMEGNHDFYRNLVEQHREGYYLTHLITDEAVEWLNIQNSKKPFFLYLPYTVPHEPYQTYDEYKPKKLTSNEFQENSRSDYITMVEDFDHEIGEIMKKVKEKGFEDNTLVIFFSDNGGNKNADNGIFKGHKGEVYEGGIHVPCIIKWPGRIKENSVSEQITMSFDLTASILSAVDAELQNHQLDGYDIISHVVNQKENFQRNLFWRVKRGEMERKAVRAGDYKYLIVKKGDAVIDEKLFNLELDPSEQNNLLNPKKLKTKELQKKLSEWEQDVVSERLKKYIKSKP